MVMVILVTVTLMVAALLQLGSFNQIETVRMLRNTQAHWLAEAGLERALSRVMGSKDYREMLPDSFINDETLLGGLGSYAVEITRTSNANPLLYDYTITSTGTASNNASDATNTVRLSLTGGAGGQQAIMALGGSSQIQNSDVYGTIYQAPTGPLEFKGGNSSVSDIVDAKNGITGNVPNPLQEGDLNPGPPTLDRTPYTTALTNTASYSATNLTFSTINDFTNNLANGTNYVNGTLTINTDIPANRALVVNGTVTIGGIIINSGVKIVAGGNVSSDNHVILKGQTEIFTLTNIILGVHSDVLAEETALLAMGNIISYNHLSFTGIIYAEGTVKIETQATVTGTIIAGQGFDIKNATVTYDPSVFANPNPVNYGNGLAIQTGTMQWEEAPFN